MPIPVLPASLFPRAAGAAAAAAGSPSGIGGATATATLGESTASPNSAAQRERDADILERGLVRQLRGIAALTSLMDSAIAGARARTKGKGKGKGQGKLTGSQYAQSAQQAYAQAFAALSDTERSRLYSLLLLDTIERLNAEGRRGRRGGGD